MDRYNKFQIDRLNDINFFLNKINEIDIDDDIIDNIHKKYPKTKYYTFHRPEELYEGMLIRTVELNLSKMSITGKIVQIEKHDGAITSIVLTNSIKNIRWHIKPQKYYIFEVISDDDIYLRQLKDDLIKILTNKN